MVKKKVVKLKPEEYKSPLDIPYIKNLIFTLSTIGAWPYKVLGHKQWFADFRNSKVLFVFWLILDLLMIEYMAKNISVLSFVEMGRIYINVLMGSGVLPIICSTWVQRYVSASKDFINKMHLFYHKDENEYSMKVYNEVEKLSDLFSKIIHFELYFGVFLYDLTPLYNSYQRGMFRSVKPANNTYDQACHFDLRFNHDTDFKGFLFVYFINLLLTIDVASGYLAIDLFLSVIVFHLWGHLKILQHNLRHLPRPAMKGVQVNALTNPPWYDEEESKVIRAMLIDSMKHYTLIKDFMDEMSMAFGLTIVVYHLFHQISGCILLLEMAQMKPEAFGTYGMLTVSAFQQLIQMSIIFELIGSQSESIEDAVYDVPWECMDPKNRRIVLIYLCNVQQPMALKALGILPVGVRTMASILKTSFSYFMLLRTSVD